MSERESGVYSESFLSDYRGCDRQNQNIDGMQFPEDNNRSLELLENLQARVAVMEKSNLATKIELQKSITRTSELEKKIHQTTQIFGQVETQGKLIQLLQSQLEDTKLSVKQLLDNSATNRNGIVPSLENQPNPDSELAKMVRDLGPKNGADHFTEEDLRRPMFKSDVKNILKMISMGQLRVNFRFPGNQDLNIQAQGWELELKSDRGTSSLRIRNKDGGVRFDARVVQQAAKGKYEISNETSVSVGRWESITVHKIGSGNITWNVTLLN
ncbi:Oidioi.mRNA.OKI2018_I69.chr1.g2790.t1.cds [Oikopleura dioica]|uniref:Oidioi.mRNA.OKI2018_I69.chr1.g2790.t1.cds n=1 Tax=Oikopleura dioica TaxID=34765 RepID=A0ABN7SXK7_OIKDI|nr:Oidioi.mRNA.OKI2018_I69.chr1.g2790.t1.cds [Oikopleura dioica]